jgi:perosamine synthetase
MIRRTIPPSAAPISISDLMHGLSGIANRTVHAKLESEIRDYFGVEHVFLVSSGKAALFLILSGLHGLTGKRKVIIPAYTCFSVPSAIRMAGLDIVPCDIRPETLDYDFPELRSVIDDDTLCIVATHLFGIPSDVERIRSLCGDRGIYIIEDGAQAMGADTGHGKLGTLGDAGFFSFGRGKNITCGSGGVIITSVEDIAESIRGHHSRTDPVSVFEYIQEIVETIFLSIFLNPYLYWFPRNLPFLRIGETRFYPTFPVHEMSGFKAGLLYDWRRKLEHFNRCRSRNGDDYMGSIPLPDGAAIYSRGIPYLRFPVYARNRTGKEKLCREGGRLGISPMYPCPVHRIREIQESFPYAKYAHAEAVADTLVALPTHVLLKENDKWEITDTVRSHAAGSHDLSFETVGTPDPSCSPGDP